MKVSIITVVFNREKVIENAIQSVLSQDYPNIEYIVVDGASRDNTLAVVKKYENKIAKIISEKDKGMFDGMNKGIKAATGDIIGMLHSDDAFGDEHIISSVVEAMEKENADVAWGDLAFVDENNPDKVIRFWKSSPYKSWKLQFGWHPPHTTFFAKKELFEKYGYYDLNFDAMGGDYELVVRFLKLANPKTVYIPRVITRMKGGGMSDWTIKNIRNIMVGNREAYRTWRKNKLRGGYLVPILKPLSKIFQKIFK